MDGIYLRKTLQILAYVFEWLYFSQCLVCSSSVNYISSNTDDVLSINPSANLFVLGDFNVHHKDWLIYSGGTDRSGELCYSFYISYDITQVVNFPTWITVLAFWISLFLLGLAFVLEWFSLYWEILIMLLSQFPLTFHHIHNRMPRFIALRVNFLVLTRIFFGIIWEKFHESISLNSLFLLLLVSFVGGFRLELMYISLIESIRSNLTLLHVFSWLCYSHISQKLLFSFVPKG